MQYPNSRLTQEVLSRKHMILGYVCDCKCYWWYHDWI